MKKKGTFWKSFLMLFHPLTAIVYGIFWFELYKLAMYGDVNKRAPLLFGTFGFLFIWFLFYILILSKIGRSRDEDEDETEFLDEDDEYALDEDDDETDIPLELKENTEDANVDSNEDKDEIKFDSNEEKNDSKLDAEEDTKKESKSKERVKASKSALEEDEIIWISDEKNQTSSISSKQELVVKKTPLWMKMIGILMLLVFLTITAMGAYGIYYSSIPYNGKLSWELESLHKEREITFAHNDINKYGVQGIFEDVNQVVSLPKELYLSGNLDLTYSSEGKITSFDAFVYGKNKQDQTQSFLITYDVEKNAKIIVYLNNKVSANYDAGKNIEPFFNIMKVLDLSKATSGWEESKYSVLYRGKRNWGYDATGIYMLDESGTTTEADKDAVPIIGYSVSVYIKGKESSITPRRYVATWEKEDMYKTSDSIDDDSTAKIKVASDTESQQ